VTSNDIVCNGGPNPTSKTSTVITVQAGSQATLTWRHTLTSGANDVIDSSHKGPVMAYLKKVSDAKSDSGVGNGWFKVCSPNSSFDLLEKLTPTRSPKTPSTAQNGVWTA
jgi:hypothetical protein